MSRVTMSNFQKKYKTPAANFGDPAAARVIRAQKQQTTRKSDRAATFTRNRNVPNASEVGELPVEEDRMNKLLEWKAKRDKQRRIEQMNRKKEFVVRGVSKNIFSLPADNIAEKQPCARKISPPKRITKATEKRLLRKQQSETSKNDKKVATKNDKKVATKNDKKVATKNDKKVATETGNNTNNNFKSLKEPDQELLFGKTHITFDDCSQKNSNNSIVETHNNDISCKSEHNDSSNEPAFFSPYIVSSRGKRNARNEEQMKRGLSLNCSLKDNIPTKDTIIKNLNISVEEEERTAQYFHFLLNKEIDRLNELCDKWTAIKEESGITEDGQYHIQQAIGQTTLLISKKFERFRGLVADCETGKGTMLVTCKDLQGFWDMMYMEIKNCDSRFDTLEQLRSQGWKEKELYVVSKLPKRNKTAVKKKVVPKKASSFRNFIVRRRKERVEGAVNTNDMEVQIIHNENKTERSTGCNDSKPSSVKHKVSKTKSSLLHEVQLLAAKKQRSSLARMKISQIYKTPQVTLDNTIFYINSDQTPKKSILKQPRKSNEIASGSKSVHKVNFDDSVALNEIPISEEIQTKMDLAAALSRIDDLNFNDSIEDDVPVHANLRLTFDDSSSEECKDVSDTSMHSEKEKSTNESINMPLAKVESAETLESHMLLNNSIDSWPRRTLRRQLAIDESAGDTTLTVVSSTPFNETVGYVDLNLIRSLDTEEETHEHNETVKVLRNRSITATNTLTPRRRSRKMSTNKQLEFKENIDSKDGLSDDISTIRLNANSKTKKFKRSIKFSGKEEKSNIYTEKEVFPTTPHVRSKTQSNNKKKRRTTSENPMSIGSPAPKSTRRSLSRNRVTSA
ncbi:uncharacterized protein LOC117223210 isoform X1 [Megalopta genalis]|uniref:uncharacterized protein LOC117223210 isoform X1 n=1 Tax=Megalopta genalis TaxID=115081 RepID=UPI003FD3EDFD